jgi:undecaprenyl-diphosphatase
MVTAWAAVGVGFLLLLFDRACMTVKRVEHAGFGDALLLGFAEAAALVPGVGRIGAATAMARLLGYERADAARFAFLISIPVLFASAGWHVPQIAGAGQAFPMAAVLVGAALAFIVALALLSMLMNWLRRRNFTPFAIYRMAIGVNLLVIAYGWLHAA